MYKNRNKMHKSKQSHHSNNPEDEDIETVSVSSSYVDIHGRPLEVVENDFGEIYIPLKEIRATGFTIFRRENFHPFLLDKEKIINEFNMHMLGRAREYLLNVKVQIDRQEVLKTIKRCEEELLGTSVPNRNQTNSCAPPVVPNVQKSPGRFTYNIKHENYQQQHKPSKTFADRTNDNSLHHPRPPKPLSTGFEQNPKSQMHDDTLNGQTNNINKPKLLNNSIKSDSSNVEKFFINMFMPQTELGLMQTEKVKIVHVENKGKGAWGIPIKNKHIEEKLYFDLNELPDRMPDIKNPTIGTLAMAPFENVWCRVLVCNTNVLTVQFVDYGNISRVACVKKLPNGYDLIPAQANRFVLHTDTQHNWSMDEILTITPKKRYEDGTYVVLIQPNTSSPTAAGSPIKNKPHIQMEDVKVEEKVVTPVEDVEEKVMTPVEDEEINNKIERPVEVEKSYMDIPAVLTNVAARTKVQLVEYVGNELYMRTKEGAERFKNITNYIKDNITDESPENFQIGQMVIAPREIGSSIMLRAELKNIIGTTFHVKFIDIVGEVEIPKIYVRNVDSFLAEQGSTLIKKEFKNLAKYLNDKEIVEFLDKLLFEKVKFVVFLDNGFDLATENGEMLSDVLNTMYNDNIIKVAKKQAAQTVPMTLAEEKIFKKMTENISLVKKVPQQSSRVFFSSMDSVKLKLGINDCFCYSYTPPNQITLLSLEDQEVEWLTTVGSVTVNDNEPYMALEGEMCLALFKDPDDSEVSWYRGLVMEISDEGYDILFVDFGNSAIVPADKIRSFPKYLQEIPILGVLCEIQDIPNNPVIVNRLTELLADSERIIVDVKGSDSDKVQIVIPDIMKKLRNEGLLN